MIAGSLEELPDYHGTCWEARVFADNPGDRLDAIERAPETKEYYFVRLRSRGNGYDERAAAAKGRLERYELSKLVPY